jgi:signal transduction histidine kinase
MKTLLLWLLLLFPVYAHSQISKYLYDRLPATFKPANQLHPTDAEQRTILEKASNYADRRDTLMVRELEQLRSDLNQKMAHANKREQVLNLDAISRFELFINPAGDECMRLAQRVIELAKNDTSLYKYVARAYINMGRHEGLLFNYEAATSYSFKALDYCKANVDSGIYMLAYDDVSMNYDLLGLYEKALTYRKLYVDYAREELKQSPATSRFHFRNNRLTASIYLNLFHDSKQKQYLDSAYHYINRLRVNGQSISSDILAYQSVRADYYLYAEKYDSAFAIYNSLARQFPDGEEHPYFLLLKSICQLKAGDANEGRKALLSNPVLRSNDFVFAAMAYRALYEDARARVDYKNALDYYQQSQRLEDSAALLKHRGQVFEIEQQYNLAKKQDELDKLTLKHVADVRQKKAIFYAALAITLLLLSIIMLLYGLRKRSQLVYLRTAQALQQEKERMIYFLSEQEQLIQLERNMAVAEQRRKISRELHDGLSGTLSTLKYYVADKRLRSQTENEQKTLNNIEEEVAEVYEHARDYMHNLHNDEHFEVDINLVDIFNKIRHNFSDLSGFSIRIDADIDKINTVLTPFQKNQLYLITKEAINNTLKHGVNANNIAIRLSFPDHNLHFQITDNGHQDTRKISAPGLGLKSIEARIWQLGGKLKTGFRNNGFELAGYFPLSQ